MKWNSTSDTTIRNERKSLVLKQSFYDEDIAKLRKMRKRASVVEQNQIKQNKNIKNFLSTIVNDLDDNLKKIYEDSLSQQIKLARTKKSFSRGSLKMYNRHSFLTKEEKIHRRKSHKIKAANHTTLNFDFVPDDLLNDRPHRIFTMKNKLIRMLSKDSLRKNSRDSFKSSPKRASIKSKIEEKKNTLNNKDEPISEDFISNRLNLIDRSNRETLIPISTERLLEFNQLCDKFKENITSVDRKEKKAQAKEMKAFKKSQAQIKKEKLNRELRFRKLTHKDEIYDSFSEEEEENETNIYFIDPSSKWKVVYDFILFSITILNIFFVPFQIFMKEGTTDTIYGTFVTDSIFFCDLILNFFTGYFDKNENLVINNGKIIFNYLTTWFALDLICAVPFGSYFEFHYQKKAALIGNSSKELIKFVQFLKIIKFFHNASLRMIYFKVLTTKIGSHIVIIMTILFYLMISHVLTSAYVIIGLSNDPSWIISNGLEPSEILEVYVAGFYFVFVTIFGVGYGDLKTAIIGERVFQIILLIFGVLLHSWLVSTLSEYGHEFKSKTINEEKLLKYKSTLEFLNEEKKFYMSHKHTFNRAKRFLIYNFNRQIFNSNEIFESLPNSLKCELIEFMYSPIVNNFAFFKKFKNRDFVVEVITHFNPAIFMKNERILNHGDLVEEIFFVKNGKLSVELPLPSSIHQQIEQYKKIKKLRSRNSISKAVDLSEHFNLQYAKLIEIRKNEHFGDTQLFLHYKTVLSVRISTKIGELFLLKKKDALKISESFPDIWESLIKNSIRNMRNLKKVIKKVLDVFYENNNEMLKNFYDIHKVEHQNFDDDSSDNNLSAIKNYDVIDNLKKMLLKANCDESDSQLSKESSRMLNSREEPRSESKVQQPTKNIEVERPLLITCFEDFPLSENIQTEQNDSNVVLLQKFGHFEESTLEKINNIERKKDKINEEFSKGEEAALSFTLKNNTFENSKSRVKSTSISLFGIQQQTIEGFSINDHEEERSLKDVESGRTAKTKRSQPREKKKKKTVTSPTLSCSKRSYFSGKESKNDSEINQLKNHLKTRDKKQESPKRRQEKKSSLSPLNFASSSQSSASNYKRLLLSIENNIEDNSLNLNDPKSFYSNKFNNIISKKNNDKNNIKDKIDILLSMIRSCK